MAEIALGITGAGFFESAPGTMGFNSGVFGFDVTVFKSVVFGLKLGLNSAVVTGASAKAGFDSAVTAMTIWGSGVLQRLWRKGQGARGLQLHSLRLRSGRFRSCTAGKGAHHIIKVGLELSIGMFRQASTR